MIKGISTLTQTRDEKNGLSGSVNASLEGILTRFCILKDQAEPQVKGEPYLYLEFKPKTLSSRTIRVTTLLNIIFV